MEEHCRIPGIKETELLAGGLQFLLSIGIIQGPDLIDEPLQSVGALVTLLRLI